MTRATLKTDAILLTRRHSGEHGLLLTFLSSEHGLLSAFKRTSSRGRQPLPDLFDEISLTLEKAKGGDHWFVSEYILQHRRPEIVAHYSSFLYACRYALLLSHHLFESGEAPLWMAQLAQPDAAADLRRGARKPHRRLLAEFAI
jgi:recombinational DNA repair protein (RecF pathway)